MEIISKPGINMDLIENVRGVVEYEIRILEDAFHPIFLDEVAFESIYIGGYDDLSPYGSQARIQNASTALRLSASFSR